MSFRIILILLYYIERNGELSMRYWTHKSHPPQTNHVQRKYKLNLSFFQLIMVFIHSKVFDSAGNVTYTYLMEKIINKVKKVFWLEPIQKRKIEREAKVRKVSESALIRHIINQWFQK